MKFNIVKSAGVIIENKKLLLTRTRGKSFFIAPGGKLEVGETATQSLVRELKEELNIDTEEADFELVGEYEAVAIGTDGKSLLMPTFMVCKYNGKIEPQMEVEEVLWVDSSNYLNYEVGSIFKEKVIPLLIQKKLID